MGPTNITIEPIVALLHQSRAPELMPYLQCSDVVFHSFLWLREFQIEAFSFDFLLSIPWIFHAKFFEMFGCYGARQTLLSFSHRMAQVRGNLTGGKFAVGLGEEKETGRPRCVKVREKQKWKVVHTYFTTSVAGTHYFRSSQCLIDIIKNGCL